MEDLIPLLIVIAISIIGAVGKKNKKREIGENISRPKQVSDQKDDFLSWIEKITNADEVIPSVMKQFNPEPERIAEEMQSAQIPVETKPSTPDRFANYSGFIAPEEYNELVAKEGGRAIKETAFDGNDLTKQNFFRDGDQINNPKFDFDLRKAVIYSEILKRKYI